MQSSSILQTCMKWIWLVDSACMKYEQFILQIRLFLSGLLVVDEFMHFCQVMIIVQFVKVCSDHLQYELICVYACVSFGSFLLTTQHLTTCHIRIYGIIPIESGAPCACDVSRIPSAHIGPTRKVTGNVPRIKRRRNTGGFGDVTPSSGAPKRNIHLPFIDLPTLKKLKKPCEIHPLSALLQRFGKCTFFFLA